MRRVPVIGETGDGAYQRLQVGKRHKRKLAERLKVDVRICDALHQTGGAHRPSPCDPASNF